MIKIVLEDERARPEFFCDYCEEPIVKASGGIYMWRHPRTEKRGFIEGVPTDVFTVHKGACDRAFCARMGWERDDPMTMELRVLPMYLAANMGIDSQEDWRKARRIAELGGSL